MNWPSYLIQANIYLVLFYAFYVLVLQNETFFKWNRTYLVSSAALSFLIPLIQSEWVKSLFVTAEIEKVSNLLYAEPVTKWREIGVEEAISSSQDWSASDWIPLIYIAGVLLMLARFLWRLYRIPQLFKEAEQAHSFFRKIRVSKKLPSRDVIVKHEEVHARHFHSADVILFEIVSIVNWFNPVVYGYKRSIRYIHEFIADEAVTRKGDKAEYARLLVSSTFGIEKEQLTNNFFNHSMLRKRLAMLYRTRSGKSSLIKYGLAGPLFAMMVILSSATIKNNQLIKKVSNAVPAVQLPAKIALATEPAPALAKVESKKEVAPVDTPRTDTVKKMISHRTPPEFQTAIADFKIFVRREGTSLKLDDLAGRAVFSITISDDKKITACSIVDGIGSRWVQELLELIKTYSAPINLPPDTYTFTIIKHHINDYLTYKPKPITKSYPNWLFGLESGLSTSVKTVDESTKDEKIISTYIQVWGLVEPVVLVDGEEVAYTHSTDGYIKLRETLYPKDVSYTGLAPAEAVNKFGEKARNGIVIVTTTSANNQHEN